MALIKPVGSVQWVASIAPDVIGYRVFWTIDGTAPDYTSQSVDVGNVTGVQLPFTGLEAFEGILQVGVAAIDAAGNVSDIAAPVNIPLDSIAPDAPTGVVYVAA
jgi:hypothetical protein